MTPKNLIIAMIEREREIYRIMTGLETVGMTINVFGARSDLVLLAFGVEPDEDGIFTDFHSDPFWEGMEAGDSSEQIYAALCRRIKGEPK